MITPVLETAPAPAPAPDAFAEFNRAITQLRVDCGAVFHRPLLGLGEVPTGLIRMETLSMWARRLILSDLFPPEV